MRSEEEDPTTPIPFLNGTIQLDILNQCKPVNEHLQHDVTNISGVRFFFTFVYSSIFIFGMGGNVTMLHNIFRGGKFRSVRNMLLANLGASDILLCLFAVPITPFQIFLKRWYLGLFLCKTTSFFQSVSVLVSSLTLCSIAVDRYLNIVLGTNARCGPCKATFWILSCWVMAMFLNLPLVFSLVLDTFEINEEKTKLCGLFCTEDWGAIPWFKKFYGTNILLIQFVAPLNVLTYCYLKILRKVNKDLVVHQLEMLTNEQQNKAAKRKRRVTYILILMVVAFIASWLPLTIMNILRDYDFSLPAVFKDQIYIFHLSGHSISMLSVVWNPILYFWMSESRRSANRPGSLRRTGLVEGISGIQMNPRPRRSTFSGFKYFSEYGPSPDHQIYLPHLRHSVAVTEGRLLTDGHAYDMAEVLKTVTTAAQTHGQTNGATVRDGLLAPPNQETPLLNPPTHPLHPQLRANHSNSFPDLPDSRSSDTLVPCKSPSLNEIEALLLLKSDSSD